MRMIGSREFNQDVTNAKRLARVEPVVVTDRGRPTHVLLGIDAFRELHGQVEVLPDLLRMANPVAAAPDWRAVWER